MLNKQVKARETLIYYSRATKKRLKYRIVPKELAVAAVAVLPILLIGGRGGTGAPLRAAVFILALLQLRRRVAQRPISHFVPLTRLVPTQIDIIDIDHQKGICIF